jgi:hypothetical protein
MKMNQNSKCKTHTEDELEQQIEHAVEHGQFDDAYEARAYYISQILAGGDD